MNKCERLKWHSGNGTGLLNKDELNDFWWRRLKQKNHSIKRKFQKSDVILKGIMISA